MAFLVRKTYFSWEIKNRLCLRLTNDCITCFTGTLQIFANCLTRQYRGTRNVVSFLIQHWLKSFVLTPFPVRPPHCFRGYFRRRQILPAATGPLPAFEERLTRQLFSLSRLPSAALKRIFFYYYYYYYLIDDRKKFCTISHYASPVI